MKQEDTKLGYANFQERELLELIIPEEEWLYSDTKLFPLLDQRIGGRPKGYVWHHTERPGVMQLVEYGIHNVTPHNGGRSPGMWADRTKIRKGP